MTENMNDIPEVSNKQLLAWRYDAENDLGELADIINSIAAQHGASGPASERHRS